MLASLRHFLRFIDLDETFDAHGFNKKVDWHFLKWIIETRMYADNLAIEGRSLQV